MAQQVSLSPKCTYGRGHSSSNWNGIHQGDTERIESSYVSKRRIPKNVHEYEVPTIFSSSSMNSMSAPENQKHAEIAEKKTKYTHSEHPIEFSPYNTGLTIQSSMTSEMCLPKMYHVCYISSAISGNNARIIRFPR